MNHLISKLKHSLSMLLRTAGAAPVAGDVLTYQGPGQPEWAVAAGNPDEGCHVYHDAIQNIAAGIGAGVAGDHTIAFNQELWDNTAMHNPAANNERITIATPGYYLVGAQIRLTGGAVDVWAWVRLWRWDASAAAYAPALGTCFAEYGCNNANNVGIMAFAFYEGDVGDWFEVGVRHGHGVAMACGSNARISPEFFAYRLYS